jgi:maleylpyruvate isomerase
MADPELIVLLEGGTRRLVRTVDAMTDEQWGSPSLLPGWSRAHVVAHLTLNAEGLAGALEGVREGRPVPMYASQEARDADIEALSGVPASELRERFLGSTTLVVEGVAELAANLEATTIERVPGGRTFAAGDVGLMRLRETEIHHADLGLESTADDWPVDFCVLLLSSRGLVHDGPPFTAYATDLERSYAFGDGGPTVTGTAAALAWWVTGRGAGEGLTSDDGTVPGMEAW